jgi:hypothetical protein
MTRSRPWNGLAVALVCLAVLGACNRDARPGDGAAITDTTGALGGIPPEQLQREGEAMSPEQAEQLGIVDTTIHVEDLGEGTDTVPPFLEP